MSSGFVMPTKVGVGKHARKDYDLPKQGRVAPSNACVWSGNPPGYFDRPDPTFLRILHDRFREGNFTRRKDVVVSAGNWSGRGAAAQNWSGHGAAVRRLRVGRTGNILALDMQWLHPGDVWEPVVKINLTTGLLYSITPRVMSDVRKSYSYNNAGENLTNFLLAVRRVFFGDMHPDGVQVIGTRFIDWSQYGAAVQPESGETTFISFPDASGDLWYYTAGFRLSAGQVGNLACEPALTERFAGYSVIYMPELGVNKRAGRFIAKGGDLPDIFHAYMNAVRICLTHGETTAYDRWRRPQGNENFNPDKLEAVERSFANFPLKRLTTPFGIYDLSVSPTKPVAVLKAPKDYALELAQRYIPLIILQAGFTDAAAEDERTHGSGHYYGGPDKTAARRALEALVMMLEARMHLPPNLWEGATEKIGILPLNGTLKKQKDSEGNALRYYEIARKHEVLRCDLRKRNKWSENIFRKWVKRVSVEMVPIIPLVAPAKGTRKELTFMLDGGEYALADLQEPVPNLLDLLGDETKLTGANRRW